MTALLACIRDAEEAAAVLAAGFDGVVVARSGGRADAVAAPAAARVGWMDGDEALVIAHGGGSQRRFALWRDPWPDEAVSDAGACAVAGLLVHSEERLLDAMPFARLAALATACRRGNLEFAAAGGLERPDLPRVLALDPALLLVGRALRHDGEHHAALDPARLAAMRAVVPRSAGMAAPARRIGAPGPDRIFVRDLVLSLDIGAYASEVGRPQRVRFSVEAALVGMRRPRRDMEDIVSYDLIADAVHRLARAHRVEFVETLAEEIAEALLAVPAILEVRVRVEKLDLGAGAVGVEIVRAAYDAA